MKFGGVSSFGSAMFGGDPWGFDPSYVMDRMVASLSKFQQTAPGVGSVKTIKRLEGPLTDETAIDTALKGSTPAFLIVYLGGPFDPPRSDGTVFVQSARYAVICISSNNYSRIQRTKDRNVYHPGIHNMIRWALREVTREMLSIEQVINFRPVVERPLPFTSTRFASVIEFECEHRMDVYDDVSTVLLEKIGIVHTPKDTTELFTSDNVTPNSDDDTAVSPSVAEL